MAASTCSLALVWMYELKDIGSTRLSASCFGREDALNLSIKVGLGTSGFIASSVGGKIGACSPSSSSLSFSVGGPNWNLTGSPMQ